MKILILPYKGKILEEIRPAYFLKAFNEPVFDMRIFSFGKCNYSCPYCKRGGYSKNNLVIDGAIKISEKHFYEKIDDAIAKNQVIRLSGGDPVCYSILSVNALKYVKEHGGKTSIAHNGSGPGFVKKLIPYLDFASIDFKASTPNELAKIANLSIDSAITNFNNTIKTIELLTNSSIKTDVRTCVFDSTTYEELSKIANLLVKKCDTKNLFWTLRTYSAIDGYDRMPKSSDDMELIAKKLSKNFNNLLIGVRSKWEPSGFKYYLNGEENLDL